MGPGEGRGGLQPQSLVVQLQATEASIQGEAGEAGAGAEGQRERRSWLKAETKGGSRQCLRHQLALPHLRAIEMLKSKQLKEA